MAKKQKEVPSTTNGQVKVLLVGFSQRTSEAIAEHLRGHHTNQVLGFSDLKKKVSGNPFDVLILNACKFSDDAVLAAHHLQGRTVCTIAAYGGKYSRNWKKLEEKGPVFAPIGNLLKGIFPQSLDERLAA